MNWNVMVGTHPYLDWYACCTSSDFDLFAAAFLQASSLSALVALLVQM